MLLLGQFKASFVTTFQDLKFPGSSIPAKLRNRVNNMAGFQAMATCDFRVTSFTPSERPAFLG
jgi:hypothetical protein